MHPVEVKINPSLLPPCAIEQEFVTKIDYHAAFLCDDRNITKGKYLT